MIDELIKHPTEFNFYQAMRLLIPTDRIGVSELERIDHSLELTCDAGDQFHANDISEVSYNNQKANVNVATFGLSGPLGPLPQQHSEWIYAEARAGASELKDFLNLFEHRFISLLYLIKQRSQMGLHQGDRSLSPVYRYLSELSGLPLKSDFKNSPSEQYKLLLPFAGLLIGGKTSAASVSNILSTLLNTSVKINSMQGAFITVDKAHQARLSSGLSSSSLPQRLGDSVALGSRVWDQQNAIEIEIGPVDYQIANGWIPGEEEYDQLVDLLRYTTNAQWVLHTVIDVQESSIPKSFFSNEMRLGFNSWIKTNHSNEHIDTKNSVTKKTRRKINPTHLH